MLFFIVREQDARDRLARVGVSSEVLSDLETAHAAAQQAHTEWRDAFVRSRSSGSKEAFERAYDTRARVLRAADFNTYGDPQAAERLSRIREGEGEADLLDDLVQLASFLEHHEQAFEQDKSFSVGDERHALLALHNDLADARAERLTDAEADRARDTRDRAFMHLGALVSRVRRAGQYVYGDAPTEAARFVNTYNRRRNARHRGTEEEAPVSPSQPSETQG